MPMPLLKLRVVRSPSLVARSSSTPTQHQREIAEAYTLPPPTTVAKATI
ncbi:hypothetical protein O53_2054 [Microcystis aeruginosa TAIHU98]|uniref:Uncharacterized protein n=1 Tax=Microcystis aeruginosa TAIHU98 TaxID=1134457 RepID=L7E1D1_MICAE|nr:hypothetical protein O53_2054 [Microcystis aeruginosa TAIHU98]